MSISSGGPFTPFGRIARRPWGGHSKHSFPVLIFFSLRFFMKKKKKEKENLEPDQKKRSSPRVSRSGVINLSPIRSVVEKEKEKRVLTYRHAFASNAVHDAERGAQVRMPRILQLVDLFAEITI